MPDLMMFAPATATGHAAGAAGISMCSANKCVLFTRMYQ